MVKEKTPCENLQKDITFGRSVKFPTRIALAGVADHGSETYKGLLSYWDQV